MRRLSIFFFVLLACASFVSCSRPERGAGSFAATARDGKEVTIGPEAGKVTLVHFWATWCGPCRYELPSFVEFAKANEGDRLRWVAVANDPGFDVVDEHLRQDGITMETLLDPRGSTMNAWQVNAIPTTIVLDESGRELARYVGARNWKDPAQQSEVLAFAR